VPRPFLVVLEACREGGDNHGRRGCPLQTARYDYRRIAAMLTMPDDKQALELLAAGWDRLAENREAFLRSNLNQSTSATSPLKTYETLAICRTHGEHLARAK